jgi:N6-L-threonylcarbamoyladenine synthase
VKILALESSCDDTAVAFWDSGLGFLFEEISSQIFCHRPFGGVVPEVAAREHLERFPKLLRRWREACPEEPDAIAVTVGPGLAGGLAMGFAAARSLGILLGREVFGVNHLHGHMLSTFLSLGPCPCAADLEPLLPHLGLLVSGGNSMLLSIGSDLSLNLLAKTVDDAAGEALDKGAKMLGLPYPGGVEIERLARDGDRHAFPFPRAFPPFTMKFSFSGLKTSLRYRLAKMSPEEIQKRLADLCASYQWAVVEALVGKVGRGLRLFPAKSLGLSGGVSQNSLLREEMARLAEKNGLPLLAAPKRYCGDNASMIAFAASFPQFRQPYPQNIFPKMPLTNPALYP